MQERSSHSAPPRECQHPHVPARNYLGGELTTEAYPGTTPVDKQAKETIHKIIQSPCFCYPLPYSARTATLEGGRNDPEHPGPILHAPRDYTYRQTTERNHIQKLYTVLVSATLSHIRRGRPPFKAEEISQSIQAPSSMHPGTILLCKILSAASPRGRGTERLGYRSENTCNSKTRCEQ